MPRRIPTFPGPLAAVVVAAALACLVAAAPARTAGGCTPGSDWGASRPDLASQVVQLVNAYRAGKGLGALGVSGPLTASSTWKSLHMARYGYFGHDDPAPPIARGAFTRAQDCGFTGSTWGENIAYGYASAQAVLSGWLGSAGHRANIENGSFTTIGVGVAESAGGTLYWTQSFGNDGPASSPPPAPPPPPAPAPSPPPAPAPAPSPSPAPAPPPPPAAAPAPPAPAPAPAPPAAAPPATAGGAPGVASFPARTSRARSGRRFVAAVAFVHRQGSVRLTSGDVRCRADVGGTKLRVVVNAFRDGLATCAWQVPSGAGGKTLSGVVAVQIGSTAFLRRFERTVR